MTASETLKSGAWWTAGATVVLLGLVGMNMPARVGPLVLIDSIAPHSVPAKSTVARFAADQYGQFWIDGTANGIAFRFLVDTGASSTTFSKSDARKLGIDVDALKFTERARLANNTIVRNAPTRIARLSVGPFVLVDVPVSVIDAEQSDPLLGMPTLRRWNVSISKGTLLLQEEP